MMPSLSNSKRLNWMTAMRCRNNTGEMSRCEMNLLIKTLILILISLDHVGAGDSRGELLDRSLGINISFLLSSFRP